MGHKHIGPEHLLLGVLRENGAEAGALSGLGIGLESAREVFRAGAEPKAEGVAGLVGWGPVSTLGELLRKVPADRIAAAAQILAGLASEYFIVAGVSRHGPFSYTLGKIPPAA
jgi:hypothetical protein